MPRGHSVNVSYFEYPVPHGIAKTPFHEARRAASFETIGRQATATQCFDEEAFRTRDGVHLDAEGQQVLADRRSQMLLRAGGETTAKR